MRQLKQNSRFIQKISNSTELARASHLEQYKHLDLFLGAFCLLPP